MPHLYKLKKNCIVVVKYKVKIKSPLSPPLPCRVHVFVGFFFCPLTVQVFK